MKRSFLIVLTVLALVTGCKQKQAQWGSGQGGQKTVVAPVPVKSPDEMRQLEALAKANPSNKDAWIELGNAQMDSRMYAQAILSYQHVLELDPKNVDVRVDMGTCYRGAGQPEKALEEYRRAIKINPRHPNAHRNAAVVLSYDLHRNAEAVKEYQEYLDVYPTAPDAPQIEAEIRSLKAAQ
jgi:tetratricopeptide (TPR) repeat protein